MDSFASHDCTRIAYLEEGSGPSVVLLHGLTANARVNWVEPGIVAALADAGYRVVAIDARGHDNSEAPTDPAAYHPDALAGDVVALVDHLDLGPITPIGYSYGCRTSAILASDHKIELTALVLAGLDLETTLNPHPRDNPGADAICAAFMVEDPSTSDLPGIVPMHQQLAAWNANPVAMAHIYRGMQSARPIDFDAINVPTLVINCPAEPDPSVIADLIAGAKTARLAEGNHLTGPLQPDFLPNILSFLKEHVVMTNAPGDGA